MDTYTNTATVLNPPITTGQINMVVSGNQSMTEAEARSLFLWKKRLSYKSTLYLCHQHFVENTLD
ncbi:hypothetical protein MAR_023602 [Mya arenaria]|uniref:Uncharacterized protein n=1 Tax=Mya arenaria TaxID=6604 RepID=A0ABY7DRM1_MYAAR|nr:hypothetical protein MAR_023602 [Mya arenaria]